MAQTQQLIAQLKKALKAHGMTYADVAYHLQLSEASVKRLFSEQSFSLRRLDQVCELIGIEITDLVRQLGEEADTRLTRLSEDQEREIASDLELLLVTVCALNRWTLPQMMEYFQLSEPQCVRQLARLDRLGLIELLPKNRIKLLVAPNFKWLDNGPIQRFYQEKIEADFFRSRFDKRDERLIVANGMLASGTNATFQRKMEQLIKEFDQLSHDDAKLPLEERHGTTVVLAMRQWRYGLFEAFRKPST